jgi:hypothetical protein
MLSDNNGFSEYILNGSSKADLIAPLLVNGHRIYKPTRFKNLAHERAFEIALVLASKEPTFTHTYRMRELIIETKGRIIMSTSDCIEVIMFHGITEIQLKYNATDPDKSARDAMKFVPSMFDEGLVIYDFVTKPRKMWYLEIKSEN